MYTRDTHTYASAMRVCSHVFNACAKVIYSTQPKITNKTAFQRTNDLNRFRNFGLNIPFLVYIMLKIPENRGFLRVKMSM